MTLRSLGRSLAIAASFAAAVAAQQTATYTFTNVVGAYTPITGGTVLTPAAFDDTFYPNLAIGFDFPFGGTAAGSGWTNRIGVSTNGWLKCSNLTGSGTTYSAISSTTELRVVAPFARDLQNGTGTSDVRVETIGIAPNRVCVVQWSNVRPYGSGTPFVSLSFQARLYETTGVIENVYGGSTFNGVATATTPTTTAQVGIKGSGTTDWKNCVSTSTTFSWATPNVAGTVSSSHFVGPQTTPSVGAHVVDSGRTYRYTPAAFPPAGLNVVAAASPASNYITGMPLITATVSPSPSAAVISNVQVFANLSSAGGNAAQPMLDDGVAPDAAIDGTYTCQATVFSVTPIVYTFPITASATGATNGAGAASVSVYTLANDAPMGSILVTRGVNGPFSNVTALAGNQVGFDTPCGFGGNIGGKDVFFIYTPTCTGTASFSTCGGNATNEVGELADSQLVIYSSALAVLGCNDDAGTTTGPGATNICAASGFQSEVNSIAVSAGSLYLIRVCGFGGSSGTFNLTITESSAVSSTFGVSCGNLLPTLNGTLPRLGQSGTLTLANGFPGGAGILAYSAPVMAYAQLGPCPFYLDTLGSLAIFTTFSPDALGGWTLTGTIPNDPALACLQITMQAAVFATPGLETTNGLSLTFGY